MSNIKRISFNRLEEILNTVNSNVIKTIKIVPHTYGSGPISSFDVMIGYNTYNIWVADVDDRYTLDGINLFSSIVRKYSDLPFDVTPTTYSLRCNSYTYDISRVHDDF